MSTDIANIMASIKSKLENVRGLKGVYTYAVSNTAGYPFATITDAGWDAEFSDTSRTRRNFRFLIYVFQEVSESGFNLEKSSRVLRDIQDEILSEFDSDPTLDGTVLIATPISASPVNSDERPENVLAIVITVTCTKFVTR